jgi:glycosyltransferase involved in cell wall biosynthesis
LSNDELSMHLHASDLLLLPFTDGLSTRRGTLMAGLAHGLPVVGLRGSNTDRVLLQHPDAMVLTPQGDLDAYVLAVVQLVRDTVRMQATGAAAASLYDRHFDWPVLARSVLAALRHWARPGSVVMW